MPAEIIDVINELPLEGVAGTVIVAVGVFAYFNIKYALIGLLFIIFYLYAETKLNKKLAKKTPKIVSPLPPF